MAKKMDNKTLLILLIILIAIFIVSRFIKTNKTEKSFKTELVFVDTAKVTSILLYPEAENHEEIKFIKEDGEWLVSKDDILSDAGEYAVEGMSAEGCTRMSESQAMTTSVKDIRHERNFVLYPNPAKGRAYLKSNSEFDNPIVQMFDANGKLVHQIKMNVTRPGDLIELPLEGLPVGIYHISIRTDTGFYRHRLIVR